MNPAAVFGSLCWLVVWTFAVFMQLILPYVIYVWVVEVREFMMLPLTLIVAFVASLLTACAGGFNAVPSIFWRFRNTVDARIVEVFDSNHGHRYGVRMKFFGAWLWVSAPENNGFVRVSWYPEMCAGSYLSTHRHYAEVHLANLGRFLSAGFSHSAVAESVERAVFERGVRRDS